MEKNDKKKTTSRRIHKDQLTYARIDSFKLRNKITGNFEGPETEKANFLNIDLYKMTTEVPGISGSNRTYFLCPKCGKRVRYLYTTELGAICRTCANVGYRSQQIANYEETYRTIDYNAYYNPYYDYPENCNARTYKELKKSISGEQKYSKKSEAAKKRVEKDQNLSQYLEKEKQADIIRIFIEQEIQSKVNINNEEELHKHAAIIYNIYEKSASKENLIHYNHALVNNIIEEHFKTWNDEDSNPPLAFSEDLENTDFIDYLFSRGALKKVESFDIEDKPSPLDDLDQFLTYISSDDYEEVDPEDPDTW